MEYAWTKRVFSLLAWLPVSFVSIMDAGGKQSATSGFSGTTRVDPGGIAESLLPGDETRL